MPLGKAVCAVELFVKKSRRGYGFASVFDDSLERYERSKTRKHTDSFVSRRRKLININPDGNRRTTYSIYAVVDFG
jgi:hypothetical protein